MRRLDIHLHPRARGSVAGLLSEFASPSSHFQGRHALRLAALAIAAGLAAFSVGAQEFRGLWVDTFHPGIKSAAEVRQLVADARAGHFNALIVEVRKRGDAYYHSRFEPPANDIVPAGYDPLADLIAVAHSGAPRLEVHAWLVTYPLWNGQTSKPPAPTHLFNQWPSWLMKDGSGNTWDGSNHQLDPGHPGVQEHLYQVALDLVSRYDVDGLHFDYIRYSGTAWGYNEAALNRFNRRFNRTGQPAAGDSTWLQWRRDQVTALLRRVYLSTLHHKPGVKVSAATITWAPGIPSTAQWPSSAAYASVLQDWRAWMAEGILDLNIPMAYFRQETHANDWNLWSQFAKNHRYRRHVALGAGLYLNTLSNSLLQLRSTRTPTATGNAADGLVGYSYAVSSKDSNRATFLSALTRPSALDPNPTPIFQAAVTSPAMPWKTAPQFGHLLGVAGYAPAPPGLDAIWVRLSGPVSKSLLTDAHGCFGAVDLPAGNYTLTAQTADSFSHPVRLAIEPGAVTTRQVLLVPPGGGGLLFNLAVQPGARSALVTWQTRDPANSRVDYFRPFDGEGTATRLFNSQPTTNHSILISGLAPATTYFFRAQSQSQARWEITPTNAFATAGQLLAVPSLDPASGRWRSGTAPGEALDGTYAYADTVSGNPSASATFTPNILTPGRYDVYAWAPARPHHSTRAPFEVVWHGGAATVLLDQTTGGAAWRLLVSNKPFQKGAHGFVRLANHTGESGRVVVADAVRWVYVGGQDPPAPNQVPEWWTQHYFGVPVPAAADPDQDGFSNRAEFVLGTDPSDPDSHLALWIEPQGEGEANHPILFRPVHAGRTYRLLRTTDLAAGLWEELSEPAPIAGADQTGRFPGVGAAAPQEFFRLQVTLDP